MRVSETYTFALCICSVIACVFNCLHDKDRWTHLVIITMPGGLRRVCGGGANEKCMICLRSAPRWNTRAGSSSSATTFSYQICHIISHSAGEHMARVWDSSKEYEEFETLRHQTRNQRAGRRRRGGHGFLPLKEIKTRGAAIESLPAGFPRTRLDSARRVWTVHRPSSCMVDQPPGARKDWVLFVFKSLQGQKETCEKMLSQLLNAKRKKKKI